MKTAATPLNRELLRASWNAWWSYTGVQIGPAWLQWVWTLLFCTGLAALFTLAGFAFNAHKISDWTSLSNWAFWFSRNLIVCYTIGFFIQVLFMAILPRVGPQRIRSWSNARRAVFFTAIPILGLVVGWPLGVMLAGFDLVEWFAASPAQWLAALTLSLLISVVLFFIFDAKTRQMEAEKQAAEAQLRLLQGQIEPHFLFNTLANVLTLIDVDAPKAQRMLEAFIDYLRGSLANLRRDEATLDHELGMAEAYLGLMQTRMDERLTFSIDVADDALRRVALPPLLLQPLVENAIAHGLECQVDGGHVGIQVRADSGDLVLQVEDNGQGLDAPAHRAGPRAGNGMALDNVRARLRTRYGSDAGLTLEARSTQGTRAVIRLPLPALTASR